MTYDVWLHDAAAEICTLRRYTVEETVELLSSIGFRDTDCITAHGLNGGDILDLSDQEMRDELRLSHLQVRNPSC